MVLRILAFIIVLFSILFWPFWVSGILAFLGMIYFSVFLEAIPLFLLSDLLYGTKETGNSPIIFISFFVSIAALLLIEFLKTKTRFYNK
jgi:hypothetical protein